jgi:lipid A disaccharide synthetase
VNGATPRPLSIYLVAAEESGDALGAALVRALPTMPPTAR